MRSLNLFIKQIFDYLASFVGLIVLAPLMLIIAICIKLNSKGPVFFEQERLGKSGRVFRIIKFRTMIPNAESIGDGLSVKAETDPRITMVGRFLRKTSLDELPQLFNILKGDMSIIGPRPPVVYHPYKGYENYPSWAKNRFSMKPGISGLSQVNVRNSVSWEDRIKVDLEYVNDFSFLLDLKIIFLTFKRVLSKNNIYN